MNGPKQLPENIQDDIRPSTATASDCFALINQLLDFRKAEENALAILLCISLFTNSLQNLFYVRFPHDGTERNPLSP